MLLAAEGKGTGDGLGGEGRWGGRAGSGGRVGDRRGDEGREREGLVVGGEGRWVDSSLGPSGGTLRKVQGTNTVRYHAAQFSEMQYFSLHYGPYSCNLGAVLQCS